MIDGQAVLITGKYPDSLTKESGHCWRQLGWPDGEPKDNGQLT